VLKEKHKSMERAFEILANLPDDFDLDLWIAAHAKALGLTLVTNNEKEFKRVRGLKVENWAK
jgi:predicted nucleic acid-binding protein